MQGSYSIKYVLPALFPGYARHLTMQMFGAYVIGG